MEYTKFENLSSALHTYWLNQADNIIARGYTTGTLDEVAERMYNAQIRKNHLAEQVTRLDPDGSINM